MPLWPALQLPDLYPPGAATETANDYDKTKAAVDSLLAAHPGLDSKGKRDLLKKHRFCVEDRMDVLQVYIASTIAPELDQWYEVD
jgi:hypothetical protein